MRMGITVPVSDAKMAELYGTDLDTPEKLAEYGIWGSLFNIVNDFVFPTEFFYPRCMKDLSLEYDRNESPSLAFLAALNARENGTNAKMEYEKLLKKYKLVEQLRNLRGSLFIGAQIETLLNQHDKVDTFITPFAETENLWPNYLYQEMIDLYASSRGNQ